jgi:hypothetical protein
MNGPDLRFLAERASVLEDRTRDRLDEVHARIAVARERRRTGAALGAAGLVVALIVGLAIVQHGRGLDSPEPAPNPSPTSTANVGAEAVPPPQTGTCWAVPPKVAVDPAHLHDDSRPVPCTEPHTTDTVGTFTLSEPTQEELNLTGDTCAHLGVDYLGIDDRSWIPWGVTEYLPSKAQIADGATWVRCDVSVPEQWNPRGGPVESARTVENSLAGIADAPPPELWACLAQPPTEVQPLISCAEPHAYEETGTLAQMHEMTTYPSKAELALEGPKQCRADVPNRLAGVSVTTVWDPKKFFNPPLPVSGVCFMYYPNGELLPPR